MQSFRNLSRCNVRYVAEDSLSVQVQATDEDANYPERTEHDAETVAHNLDTGDCVARLSDFGVSVCLSLNQALTAPVTNGTPALSAFILADVPVSSP